MLDILIINVPGTMTASPMAAPALLKSMLKQQGFQVRTRDFNAEFYHSNSQRPDFAALESYFLGQDNTAIVAAQSLVQRWCQDIASTHARWVGISVFTYQCRTATELFCLYLRRMCPEVKIVIGGQGIPDGGINGSSSWAQTLIQRKLIDCWVRSEGETVLGDILLGHIDTAVIQQFHPRQIQDLDSLPWPDYDDYDFALYKDPRMPITGSRGCVRRCSFCDIHTHWKRYVSRLGSEIAQEMIYQSQRYGIKDFVFTDSLVNGNQKQYLEFVRELAKHNAQAEMPLTWQGQFIIRRKAPRDHEYWQLTAASGARNLAIGIESGSESVRRHIGKEFTNDDVTHAVALMHQYGVTCTLIFLIGYPTETDQDFQDTLDMITALVPYAGKTIEDIELGSTLALLPGTPLEEQSQQLGIQRYGNNENFWTGANGLDLRTRLQRRFLVRDHVEKLGFNIGPDRHREMLQHMWQAHKQHQIQWQPRVTQAHEHQH